MIKWTSEEIALLKQKKYEPFCDTCASPQYNGDPYRSSHITKDSENEFTYDIRYPINIDPDDGSYNMKYETEKYYSLKDLFDYKVKPYKEFVKEF